MDTGRHQEAWLDNVSLTSCHPALLLQHITESGLKVANKTAQRPMGGMYHLQSLPESRTVTLEIAIREARDFARRLEAYQALCAWTREGGWLQLSSHPGQEIYVACSKMPDLGRLREWTRELTVELTAYWFPYWVDRIPTKVSGSGASGSLSLPVVGTARGTLDATINPTGGKLTTLTLTTPESSMSMSFGTTDGIASGGTLSIYRDDRHLLHIRSTKELLKYKVPSTDDELYVSPGQNTISWTANVACSVTFAAKGVYV